MSRDCCALILTEGYTGVGYQCICPRDVYMGAAGIGHGYGAQFGASKTVLMVPSVGNDVDMASGETMHAVVAFATL